MKNNELELTFKDQLASGKLFVFAYGEPTTKGYQSIFFAQKRSDLKGTGAGDDWDMELRGWNNDRIVRAIQSMNLTEIAKRTKEEQATLKNKFAIGAVFPERSIQVTHNFVPSYDGQEPRKNPAGDILCLNGKPIFEHTKIVLNESLQDTLIVHDKVVTGVSVPKVEEEFAGFN